MRILVINLDRAPERLAHLRDVFAAACLDFERRPAVDGTALSEAERARLAPGASRFGQLLGGEIGCFLSHRACWSEAASGGEPVVVMEDDVHLGRDARAILDRTDWIPTDADIVKLDTSRRKTWVDRAPAATVVGRTLFRLRSRHGGTGGYVVTPASAGKLLAMSDAFRHPVDQFMFNPRSAAARALVTYQMVPALCAQEVILEPDGPSATLASWLDNERAGRRRKRTPFQALARATEKLSESIGRRIESLYVIAFEKRRMLRVPFE